MMPKGHAKAGRRNRPHTVDGYSAYKRIYTNNHYKRGGLSFEDFRSLVTQDCHYCGEPPRLLNPFTYISHPSNKHGSYEWWQDQFIYANGIDKKEPSPNYHDLSNLLPACRICNFMKHLLGYEVFLGRINKIYRNRMTNDE